ncbi:hypothetical protein IFM89_025718 [Coptis chinensis]|uniref:RNase H type-1 domain-containing protein n=1 Tax=Coptis chinensis TaxID=261450 RepID=A0A835HFF8_9MAGN|nr:hypothetical protein IFM89_025718 [Coptis chinensis]
MSDHQQLWRTKSKDKWVGEGERNSAYFHALYKSRQSKAMIHELQNEEGVLMSTQTQIQEYAVKSYTQKFLKNLVIQDDALLEPIQPFSAMDAMLCPKPHLRRNSTSGVYDEPDKLSGRMDSRGASTMLVGLLLGSIWAGTRSIQEALHLTDKELEAALLEEQQTDLAAKKKGIQIKRQNVSYVDAKKRTEPSLVAITGDYPNLGLSMRPTKAARRVQRGHLAARRLWSIKINTNTNGAKDAATAVSAYTSNSMPWQMKYRWQNCMKRLHFFYLSHIWREGNTVADAIAKKASNLEKDQLIVCNEKPPWIHKWEVPYQTFTQFA